MAHELRTEISDAAQRVKQAIEAEAQAQAICMAHPDFRIAYDANKAKQTPVFQGAEICDGGTPVAAPKS